MAEMLGNFHAFIPSKHHLPQCGYDRSFPPELLQLQMQTLGTVCLHIVILAFLLYVEHRHVFHNASTSLTQSHFLW